MTMKLQGAPFRRLLAALVFGVGLAAAAFTNSFDGITGGSSVRLSWDSVPPQYYPLYITAQVIDKSGDGSSADAYRVNITIEAGGTSYLWTGVPYPLRQIPGGLYQLELRPTRWRGGNAPLLAKSPFFSVSGAGRAASPGGSTPSQPTVTAAPSNKVSSKNKALAIGLGVAIGVPSVAALVVVTVCLGRRQRRAAMEKRRLARREFVIN